MLLYLVIIKLIFNTLIFSYFSKYLIVCLFKFYVGKLTLITKLISGQATRGDGAQFYSSSGNQTLPNHSGEK